MQAPLDFTGMGNPIITKVACSQIYATEFDVWFPIDGLIASNQLVLQLTSAITNSTTILVRGVDYELVYPILIQSTPESNQYYSGIKLLKPNFTGDLTVRCFTMGGNWVIDDLDIAEFLTTYYLNDGYLAISHANPKVYSNFKLDLSTPQGITESFAQYSALHLGVCYIRKLPGTGTGTGGGGDTGGGGTVTPTGVNQVNCIGYEINLVAGTPLIVPHNLDRTIINSTLVTTSGLIVDIYVKNVGDLKTVEIGVDASVSGTLYLYYIK